MLETKTKNAAVNPGLYRGSVIKLPQPIIAESSQGTINSISIEHNIAAAPAALLGNALSMA
jgi:hypothetical protein